MAKRRMMSGFLLLVAVLFGCLKTAPGVAADQQPFSGTCGSSASWSVNKETKVLTIRGTGAITERIPLRSTGYDFDLVGNPYVEQIVIEEGITSIDASRPFLYLQNSSKITLPDTLRNISDTAFCGLKHVQSITIPQGVEQIGDAAFFGNYNLEEIVVEAGNKYYCTVDGVLYTRDRRSLLAFPMNKKIKDGIFVVPEQVREVAPLAFAKQKELLEVVLPDSLEELGGGAFYDCDGLNDINLSDTKVSALPDFDGQAMGLPNPDSLWDMEDAEDSQPSEKDYYIMGTFEGTIIQILILPDSVQEISGACIAGAPIFKLYLGTNYIGGTHFLGIENLRKLQVAEDNTRYMVKDGLLYSKDGTIVYGIPRAKSKKKIVLDEKVQQIAPYAFSEKEEVHIISCQGSLISIGERAFYETQIDEFRVNGNVSYIEPYAFYQCELKAFSVTGHVYSIGECAFASCEFLEADGLQIGRRLYETVYNAISCISLGEIKKLMVPNFSRNINLRTENSTDAVVKKWEKIQENRQGDDNQCGKNAYWRLDGRSVIIYGTGDISEELRLSAADAKFAQKLVIEEGITGITVPQPFTDLGSIRHVDLPDSMETITPFAFVGITQMEKIRIPKNVNQIGEGAFYGIFCLDKIQVDSDNQSFTSRDGVLLSKDMRKLIQFPGGKGGVYSMPDTVTEIMPLAFAGTDYSGLRRVILPKNLQTIGGGAFYASSVEEINLQDTQVTELPDYDGWKYKIRGLGHYEQEQKAKEEESYYYWGTFAYSKLYHLNLPDGVEEISTYCIRNSNVHVLTLGAAYKGKINCPKLSREEYEGKQNVLNSPWDITAENTLIESYKDTLLLSDCLHKGLEVRISRQNPYYCEGDGVIYNAEKTIAYGLAVRTKVDIVLEETVKNIAQTAFWGEKNLQTVSVPGNIESIGAGAFVGSGLREIKVNGTVQNIEERAFCSSKLTSFESKGVSVVKDYAFEHSYLSVVDLGQEVSFLGRGAFQNCYALQEVTFAGTVFFLAPDLFDCCPSLQEVQCPVMIWGNYSPINHKKLLEMAEI